MGNKENRNLNQPILQSKGGHVAAGYSLRGKH